MKLINCKSCGSAIAPTSDSCVKCGAVNYWEHPDVTKLRAHEFTKTPKFTYDVNNKEEITGECRVTNKFVTAVGILIGAVLGSFGSFIAAFFVGVLIYLLFTKKKTFKANLATGEWESNDHNFWREVAEVLGFTEIDS